MNNEEKIVYHYIGDDDDDDNCNFEYCQNCGASVDCEIDTINRNYFTKCSDCGTIRILEVF